MANATATVVAAAPQAAPVANPLDLLGQFLTTGSGASLPLATKKAMAVAAVRSTTRIYVLEPAADKANPTVAPDGVTKNYSQQRMIAIAFGKGSDASGKTIMCRPGKMRELLANSAALLDACDKCEKLDAAS